MRTQSPDTSPEAERVQIELIRKMSPEKKLHLIRSMTQTMIQASTENIRALHPNASEDELSLLFIELNYGKELAQCVRMYLAKRSSHDGYEDAGDRKGLHPTSSPLPPLQ